MKIIHCADVHLDSPMTSFLTPEKAKERRQEILRTFLKMIDYAAAHQIHHILIAGDLFDSRNVTAVMSEWASENFRPELILWKDKGISSPSE